MKLKSVLAVSLLAFVMTGSVMGATARKSGRTSGASQMRGTIESVTDSQITLSSKAKGKTQQETFVLNPQTKKSGNLSAGESATVRYKDENGQKIATTIRTHRTAASPSSHSRTK